jgi:hypothetical protein
MIVELRRYSVLKDRMPDMHSRMRDMLIPLFATHGVPSPIAIWESREAGETAVFTWVVKWPSYDERRSKWLNFRPVWEQARAARGGDEFVTRTDLTLIEAWPGHSLDFPAAVGACEELWLAQPRVGFGGAFRRNCIEVQFGLFATLGALRSTACDLAFGPLPQSLLLVTWPNPAVRAEAMVLLSRTTESAELAEALGTGVITHNGVWERLNRADYMNKGA